MVGQLKIPEGTQTGKLFRLRGNGCSSVAEMVGDLLCRIVVETPVNLNSRQRELLKELASFDGMVMLHHQRKNHSLIAYLINRLVTEKPAGWQVFYGKF